MKQLFTLLLFLTVYTISAQSVEELRKMRDDKAAAAAEIQAQADALKNEVASISEQIKTLVGWRTNISGISGFNLNRSAGWIANPNPNATTVGLNVGLTGIANLAKTNYFWNNKLIIAKAWQDLSTDTNTDKLDLFGNTVSDIVNLSSLGGYKFNEKLAASALGEVNTSTSNFFKPGTIDIGAGITWLPINNMTVVLHPLNYNIKFPADNLGIETTGALGAKLRVDYARSVNVLSKKVSWSTTLTSFLPYQDQTNIIALENGDTYEAGLFEYSWINTLSFEVWNGIGVGFSFGFRDAALESPDLQSFQSLGITFGF